MLRIGVVGLRRGLTYLRLARLMEDRVRVVAACDKNNKTIGLARKEFPNISYYRSFKDLLHDSRVEAVVIATPMPLHAEQSIKCLRAGKHVLCEVAAFMREDEAEPLIKTVEETDLIYMLAENVVYTRPNLMVWNMVEKGVFGELVYAEGDYIHDCKSLNFKEDGTLTWRGRIRRELTGNTYPTHAVGPVAKWLGIGVKDKFLELASFSSGSRALPLYVREKFGLSHPGSDRGFWRQGDMVVTLIRTEQERLILLRYDTASNRPHIPTTHHLLQGTKAAYLSPRWSGDDPLIWIKGESGSDWENLWRYAERFEHPLWVEKAKGLGHGGGDYIVFSEFINSVRTGRSAINVYEASAWSMIIPLSKKSEESGGKPVKFPEYLWIY